ncbi:hypothetical protein [Saccharothrix stipae]
MKLRGDGGPRGGWFFDEPRRRKVSRRGTVATGTSPRDRLDPSITLDVVVWDLPG